jgi:tripartite-type tricarboxylate transporter receptor subunit TctC
VSQEIGGILKATDIQDKFAAQGADIAYLPAAEFDRFLAREREQWAKAIKASGAKLE